MSALVPGASTSATEAHGGGPGVVVIPQRKVPVLAEADVLVCGGGTAGIAAACSAARHGASVILIERWPCVGGMATAALVNGWHRSDRQKMVIYGLVEEAAQRARKRGWIKQDQRYPLAHETHWFDPEGMKIVFQDMLDESGVRTFGYMVAGEPIVEAKKNSRRAGRCQARTAGDPGADRDRCHRRRRYRRQGGLPLRVRPTGRRPRAGHDHDVPRLRHRRSPGQVAKRGEGQSGHVRNAGRQPRGDLPPFNFGFSLGRARNRCIPNMCPVAGNPLQEDELTRLTARGRKQVHAYWDWLRTRVPGLEHVEIEQTGFSLGVRESRRVHGLKTLDREMVLGAVKQPDAIGHGIWMIDIHDPQGSGYTTWNDRSDKSMVPRGQSYHIPLGMCLNASFANLGVVGRCASSTHEGHASVRVQTHCMVMGQGVGTCAALALKSGVDMAQVEIGKLQSALRKDGVYLHDVP